MDFEIPKTYNIEDKEKTDLSNEKEKKIDIKNIENIKKTKERIEKIHDKEKASQQIDPDSELYANLHELEFKAPKEKEINKGKIDFKLGKINGYIDIDNQAININGHIYKLKLPHNATLDFIKINPDGKMTIGGRVGFFRGKGTIPIEKLKKVISKLNTLNEPNIKIGNVSFNKVK